MLQSLGSQRVSHDLVMEKKQPLNYTELHTGDVATDRTWQCHARSFHLQVIPMA